MRSIGEASFIEPMLLLRSDHLPDDLVRWQYELKLDGYRGIAFKHDGKVSLRSRNNKDFSGRYREIARVLRHLPNETVVDGEIVALDPEGKPSFNLLQNYGSSPSSQVFFYVFDLLMLSGESTLQEPLYRRREQLESVLHKLQEPIRYLPGLDGSLADLTRAVREQGLEGLVAKRRDSVYEPGARSGAWRKMRINRGQELVIGGYTLGGRTFDALVLGYYESNKLMYASRTRNGFTPAIREQLLAKMRTLATDICPFANLPEKREGRWGQGLTLDKMKSCQWLQPKLVGQFEFVEWTPDGHLRHVKFAGLREDKDARHVRRE
jgi:DNA ligase D-like protein (predicted ligase)